MGRVAVIVVALLASVQSTSDPDALIKQAERLVWLSNWARAAPLSAEAERLFTTRGDQRNALFAQVNQLRAQFPTLSAAESSRQLVEYVENPIVQTDDQLWLRCLVIKGDADLNLDPDRAAESSQSAYDLAKRLGEQGWANRADGELGIATFLQGDASRWDRSGVGRHSGRH
jgi:hypothetical protein